MTAGFKNFTSGVCKVTFFVELNNVTAMLTY